MLSHAACSMVSRVVYLVTCRGWAHAANVTTQRVPTIRFSATCSFGTRAWWSTPLRKPSGTVLMHVPSSEESPNILAPLHACDLCPHRLVQGFWLPSRYYRKSDCTVYSHDSCEG